MTAANICVGLSQITQQKFRLLLQLNKRQTSLVGQTKVPNVFFFLEKKVQELSYYIYYDSSRYRIPPMTIPIQKKFNSFEILQFKRLLQFSRLVGE